MSNRKQRKQPKRNRNKRTSRPRTSMSSLTLPGVSIVPDRISLKLKYNGSMASTANAYGTTLALNGIYDVDLTNSGHQPLGFDQWMSFYGAFEVHASTVKIQFQNLSNVEYLFAIYPSLSGTPLTLINTAAEQPYAMFETVAASDANPNHTRSIRMGVAKLEGRQTYSINYVGSSASNPVNIRYWHMLATASDGVSNMNMRLRYTVTYDITLFQRISLAQS